MPRHSRFIGFVCASLLAVAVSGCSDAKRVLGFGKTPPDEFLVVKRAPLSMPPNYALRPPRPGEPRPQEEAVREQAKKRLFQAPTPEEGAGVPGDPAAGRTAAAFAPAPGPSALRDPSAGEIAILRRAGAINSDTAIRQVVDEEAAQLAEDGGGIADYIMFWRKREEPGTVINPTAERRRLEENVALGRPVTVGQTPVIERKKSGVRVFGDILPTSLF